MNRRWALVGVAVFFTSTFAIADEPRQTLEQRCTSDEASSYQGSGGAKTYVFDVRNKCSIRLRCELNISILNAFGLKRGHKVLVIGPNSHDSLVLKLKAFGGLNQHNHSCKEI
jgi:hypothetical protein